MRRIHSLPAGLSWCSLDPTKRPADSRAPTSTRNLVVGDTYAKTFGRVARVTALSSATGFICYPETEKCADHRICQHDGCVLPQPKAAARSRASWWIGVPVLVK
jgi:hypothetical protein